MLTPADPRQQIAAGFILALLVVLTLVALVTVGRTTVNGAALPPTPPSPSPTVSIGRSTTSPPAPSSSKAAAKKAKTKPTTCKNTNSSTFGGSAPAEICVPAIGVDTTVMQLGLNSDRTVQVPPLSEVGDAGWYKYSAVPGKSGPTVILGHIDSAQYGEGVFYNLGKLGSGDQVVITRGDGMVATYSISRVDEVAKSAFPTMSVYGPTAGATIRLVTCGGQFDAATGNYLDNIIAYGTLESLHKS